jgi:PAS domain S-box-containing protein
MTIPEQVNLVISAPYSTGEAQPTTSTFLWNILNGVADPIFVKDRQHRWVFLNDAFCRFVGYSRLDLLGKSDHDFFPLEEANVFWATDELVFKTGISHEHKEYLTDALGRTYLVATHKYLFQDESHGVFLVGTIRRVALKGELEANLQESQQLLKRVIDTIPQAIFWKDRDLVYLGCNYNFAQLAGAVSPQEILGKTDAELAWPSAELTQFQMSDRQVIANNSPHCEITQFHQTNGQVCWLEIHKIPLHDATGNVIGLLGMLENISERKQAEEALLQSEATNRALIEAIPDLLMRIRQDGTYLQIVSKGNFRPFDPINTALGKTVADVLPPDLARERMQTIQKTLQTQRLHSHEQDLMINGQLHHEEVRIVPIEAHEVLVMVRDVTARRRAEAALQNLNEALEGQVEQRTLELSCAIAQLQQEIAERQQIEHQLRVRDRHLEGLAEATYCLLTMGDFEQAMQHALMILGTAMDIDRVSICKNHADPEMNMPRISQPWQWENPEISSEPGHSGDSSPLYHAFPDWYDTLRRGCPIFGLVKDFPPSIIKIKSSQHVLSLMLMPIIIEGEFWGFIEFDDCHGERLWSESEQSILRATAASIGGAIARVQIERTLALSEERYRSLTRANSQLVWVADADGQVRDVPEWREYTGQSTAEVVGHGWLDAIHPDDRSRVVAIWARAIETKSTCEAEYRLRDKQGNYRYFVDRGLPLLDENGQIREWVGMCTDIHDRKQAELALQESEQKFRQMANGIHGYFWLVSTEDNSYLYISPGYERIWGLSAQKLYEDPNDWLSALHPDDIGRVALADTHQQEGYDIEYRMIRPDGQIRWIHDRAYPVHDAQGKVYRIAGIADDITVRKQVEEALRQKALELEATLRELQRTQAQLVQHEKMSSLGQLVAGVAHEINNPVNFIYGNLTYAKSYIADLLNLIKLYQKHYPPISEIEAEARAIELDFLLEDLPKLLASMKIGADRIQQIVTSLRIFSRMDEAAFKAVDIHEGIDSTLMILQNRIKARPDRPEISVVKAYGSLPLVECYAGQLNQVFMNILVNAIDALDETVSRTPALACLDATTATLRSPHTPMQITIRTETTDDGWVVVRIADNGPGIPESVQQRLFDPFFTTKSVGKGTGMGLSISYQIITEKHGGFLSCVSAPGQGAEFVIKIPIHQTLATKEAAIE